MKRIVLPKDYEMIQVNMTRKLTPEEQKYLIEQYQKKGYYYQMYDNEGGVVVYYFTRFFH